MHEIFRAGAIRLGWCDVNPYGQIESPSLIEREPIIQAKKIHPALGSAAAGWK